ncbi:MAG: hypothetical protein GXP27_03045 [Planctomycetes bacterium]|nr:hypothetical protein [Planctomycetota bacterium]
MSEDTGRGSDRLSNVIRVTQIIAGAILAGLAMMAGIFFAMGMRAKPAPPSVMTYVAVGAVLVGAVMRTVLHGLVATSKVSELRQSFSQRPIADDEELKFALAGAYQAGTIAGFAVIEGAGFFAWILYVMHPSWMGLAAAIFALLVMIVTFPSRSRILNWIEEQAENLRLESPQ